MVLGIVNHGFRGETRIGSPVLSPQPKTYRGRQGSNTRGFVLRYELFVESAFAEATADKSWGIWG